MITKNQAVLIVYRVLAQAYPPDGETMNFGKDHLFAIAKRIDATIQELPEQEN